MSCRRFCVVLLAAGLLGCATTRSHTGLPAVPFIPQKPGYCGPAALAMVANYYGQPVTQDEIAAAVYQPDLSATLTTDLANYAARWDFWSREYRGSLADLQQKLSAGVPLIVLGKLGRRDHFFVVLDWDRRTDTVWVHSDTRPYQPVRGEDFRRWWDRANRWTLLVCPPQRITWRLNAAEHNDLGLFFETRGQLATAAGHYRWAAELERTNSYYFVNLGNALLKQRLLREAISAYRRAVAIAPSNADALNNLAYAYAEAGVHLDEAAQLCEQAIRLNPAHRAYYLDTLGTVLLRQGNAAAAVAAYREALAATTEQQASLRAGIEQRLAAARALVNE